MPIQDAFGKLGFFEDFQGLTDDDAVSISDTVPLRWKDMLIVAISGTVDQEVTVDEGGGVIKLTSGAGGAAGDGASLLSAPMQPSGNGTIVVVGRWKVSSVTDYRSFFGWQETADRDETINPFTLSGTTLTANNGGQVVGFYYDTQATTDGFRFMASNDGTALTTAALDGAREGSTTLGTLGILAGETIANDSWIVTRVEIDQDGTARGYLGTAGSANQNGLTLVATLAGGALDRDALYHPHLTVRTQSTGDPDHEIDYFGATGNRDWTT